jgi:uncharacterized damage-inducible protein DinB
MPAKIPDPPLPLAASLVQALDINCRITRYLVENLDPEAWHAPTLDGKGRKVAAIVAHLHNVRRMWLKAPGSKNVPEQLEKEKLAAKEALTALDTSAAACIRSWLSHSPRERASRDSNRIRLPLSATSSHTIRTIADRSPCWRDKLVSLCQNK